MQFSKKIVAIASAAALAVGGVTTAAVAAIPDSDDGEFHACVANTGPVRAMYAIDAEGSEACAAGYTEKTWATAPATDTHYLKTIKKIKLSGGSGGLFGDTWNCPVGYVAVSVGWEVNPSSGQSTSDVIVWPVEVGPDPDGVEPRSFRWQGHSWRTGSTGGQVEVEVKGTCMTEVVSEGQATS